jgi:hypothetical protein
MLMFEIISKYKRLQHEKLLHSTLIYSNTNNNKSSTNNKQSARKPAAKFDGAPCAYHTKLLGHAANHSDAQCRAAKSKQ